MKVIKKHKVRLIFYLSIISISLSASFVFFVTVLRPVFLQRMSLYAQKSATEIINKTIVKTFSPNENNYSDVVFLEKNSNGGISAIKTDTIEMNKIRAQLTDKLEKEIKTTDTQYAYIPIGSIFRNELISGIGPDIKIKIRPLGIASVDFFDNFESCGINQSKHTIYIIASVDVSIVTSQAKTTKRISSKIPISETVIVGDVPKYFGTNSSLETNLDE